MEFVLTLNAPIEHPRRGRIRIGEVNLGDGSFILERNNLGVGLEDQGLSDAAQN